MGYWRGSVLWRLPGIIVPVLAPGSRGFCSPMDQWCLSIIGIIFERYVDGISFFHGSSMPCTFSSPIQKGFSTTDPVDCHWK